MKAKQAMEATGAFEALSGEGRPLGGCKCGKGKKWD